MGWLGHLRAALDVPAPFPPTFGAADQVGVATWEPHGELAHLMVEDLWGPLDPDLWPVSREQAMTVPSVAACHHRVVGTLSRLPLVAETAAGGARTTQTGLLDQPDPGVPHTTTMRDTLSDLLFHGQAWWGVTATYADGRPLDVVAVPVGSIVSNEDGQAALAEGYADWLARARGVAVLLGGTWLIRFDGPHAGLCTIGQTAVRSAMRLEASVLTAAANPVPSMELHQTTDADIPDTTVRAMIAQWEAARRKGGVGYTNAAVELRTHGLQPEQLLIGARNQQAVDMARLAGIPASSIDAAIPGASLTYANLMDRLTDLVNFGLQPYAASVTARLSMDDVLPHGTSAKFDYSSLYPDVPTARAAAPATPLAPDRQETPA
jgi:hypothetical protein